MESEKVKVIKVCLDRAVKDYQSEFGGMCLTYINELESENERLKNRVAELENGIAKSMLGCEFLPECTNEKLKQFAERLKKKFDDKKYFLVAVSSVHKYLDETLKELQEK